MHINLLYTDLSLGGVYIVKKNKFPIEVNHKKSQVVNRSASLFKKNKLDILVIVFWI